MEYALAKELKDAGFPQNVEQYDGRGDFVIDDPTTPEEEWVHFVDPTLEELLEAMGEHEVYFFGNGSIGYKAWVGDTVVQGATAVEVAAKLWLALNKK